MGAKVIYRDAAVGAETDAAASATYAHSRATPSLLASGVSVPALITMEHNMFLLNGSRVPDSGQSVPYRSSMTSGTDCTLSTPPVITISFDSQYTSLGITLRFSPATGEFCSSVRIAWYQAGTLLSEKDYAPTSAEYFCANTVTAYDKVVITLYKTNLPQRFAKLEHVLFGVVRVFQADELVSAEVLQGINLISADLAVNTLKWKLKSHDDIEYIFQLKQAIEAYNNENLIGVFYITGSTRLSERSYEISCEDAIGVLDGSSFAEGIYNAYSAVTLIKSIVGDEFDLTIDSAFSPVTVTGYLPQSTRRAALLQVCFAIGAIVDTSGTDAIKITQAQSENPMEIPLERTCFNGSVETAAITTAVEVTAHTYTKGSGSSGDDIVEVDGVTYIHTSTVTRISNPNVTSSDKQNIIAFKDATLVNPSNVSAVAQRVYDYYSRRDTLNTRIFVDTEAPGDYKTAYTPWHAPITGNIEEMVFSLSGVTAADIKIKGSSA